MIALPTGVVTFLFTDIEGSTRLLQELGDGYGAVQDAHTAILRRAIADAGGVEIRTEGDSFFAVFHTPAEAVRAAVAALRGLAAAEWPHRRPLRVRIGIHTGEGRLGGDDYIGIDVNRAARTAAAAHGGQVVVSGATRALVERILPEGVALRDLGEHRLKDLEAPEHLHDLVVDGLPAEFPPLRSLDAPHANNLPQRLSTFVGRETQVAELRALVGQYRLVTLTGPGGIGKTRLALRAAALSLQDFADGVFFVDLSATADPGLVPSAIAHALGAKERAGAPLMQSLRDHLAEAELMLVLDNFEQVTPAATVVEELLGAAPRRAGDEPHPAAPGRRARVRRAPAGPSRSQAPARPRAAFPVRGGRALHRARPRRTARLRRDERERPGGRRDLRPPRWAPARDRACRGARQAPEPTGHLVAPRPAATAPHRRRPRPAGPPADAPRRDRVEPRSAR